MSRAGFDVQRIALHTGVVLDYVEQGRTDGAPVLLMHGVTDSWRSFEGVLPYLPPHLRVFAISQRGHGDSDRPASAYTTAHFAADTAAFADAIGAARVLVVGHSMGATHAMHFAAEHPHRCAGLVLAGAFASYRGRPDLAAFADEVAALEDPVDEAFALAFQRSTLARPVAPGLLDTAVAESLKLPAHVWRQVFAGLMADDTAALLPLVSAPALLIHGSEDVFAGDADQRLLLGSMQSARLVRHAGAGHAMHWEDPKRFAADVTAFADALLGVAAVAA